MYIMLPLALDASNVTSNTVPEPDASMGEVAWAAGTYAVGDRRIRTSTHRVYECVQTVDASVSSRPPEELPAYWNDEGPTNRWAFADEEVNTQTQALGELTVVVRPGFVNAIALYGLDGAEAEITVRSSPGGPILHQQEYSLQEPPEDWYEWLFSPIAPLATLTIHNLLPEPDAEVTITIRAGSSGALAKLGMVVLGDLRPWIGGSDWGGTEDGASVEPITYSYISTDKFGKTTIQRRHSATNLRVSVKFDRAYADQATSLLRKVLGVPCAFIVAPGQAGFAELSAFGLGSGRLVYDHNIVTAQLDVQGMI